MLKAGTFQDVSDNLPDGLARNLVSGHFKPCSALVALCDGLIEPPSGRPVAWFATTERKPKINALQSTFAKRPWPSDVTYLQARHVVRPLTEESIEKNAVAIIRQPWSILGDQVHWVEYAIVVRDETEWKVLPLFFSDGLSLDGLDECSSGDELLVILEPEYHSQWSMGVLRNAMARAEWAFHRVGLTAFLIGVIDLDKSTL